MAAIVAGLVLLGLWILVFAARLRRPTALERRARRGGTSERMASRRHVRGFDEDAYGRRSHGPGGLAGHELASCRAARAAEESR